MQLRGVLHTQMMLLEVVLLALLGRPQELSQEKAVLECS